MDNLQSYESFLNEKKPAGAPDFYHSDAPDANGRFRDLGIKDLAKWLIKTRKGDVKKISGSLTQQVVFNRNEDPKYAEKMEKVRKEVYKQLDRQDLIDNMDESLDEAKKFYKTKDIVKMAKIAGDIVLDAKDDIQNLSVSYGDRVPVKELEKVLNNYDLELEDVMESLVDEAFIGPFVFNDKMSDDELKAMYDGAIDGYAYYAKGMQYPKSDYKKAYQEIEKILKKRGVAVNEAKLSKIHKAAKKGSYPVSIVVINSGMVVKQELVNTPAAVPAVFNELQKKYPNATISVESKTGQILFSESLVIESFVAYTENSKGEYKVVKVLKDQRAAKAWRKKNAYLLDDDSVDVKSIGTAPKKDWDKTHPELATESIVNEAKPAGLSKKETLKVAQKFAAALTKLDGMKYTVSSDYEEDSFDLDIEDQEDVDPRITGEYAGGSYNINDDGSVVNMAVWNKKNASPVYGNMDDDIKTIIKTIKNIKESVVTEAKFVKDFNRDVLNAKTKEEVLELYPNAEFFIGKSDHFFGELDGNLFFKAYYTKGQKEFEIKSVYSEKGSNYVHLYNESVVTEAKQAPAKKLFKMVVNGSTSEIEGVKISKDMAQAALDWYDRSPYARKYDKQVQSAGMGVIGSLIFGDNWGIKKRISSKLKAEFKELQKQYKREVAESNHVLGLDSFLVETKVYKEAILENAVRDLHFETDPKKAEDRKIAIGKSQGEVSKKKQIDGGNYSLRRFRKEIGYGKGDNLDVFIPGSYDAVISKLGDGPHKKAVKKVKWTQKKYDQWLEDMASNGGAKNAFDMAQNAKNEPGLIDWVKKQFRGDDPMQRIQWDIEAFAESVIIESIELADVYDLISHHRFNKDFKKLSSKDKEWVESDAEERGFTESLTIESFNSLLRELNEAKPGPDGYMTGLDDEDKEDKEDAMKKQAEMDDDDPDAYKELPGDKEAQEKGKVKTSKHVKSYHELYGDKKDESMNEDLSMKIGKIVAITKYNPRKNRKELVDVKITDYIKKPGSKDFVEYELKGKKSKVSINVFKSIMESNINEEKAEGDRGPISDDAIETGLKNKSKETGVPIALLRLVMRRGLAAWKSGHRPGATQQQWGYARVNSFLTKQPGTWGGADSDIAKEVRDGGHDSKLKKA